MKIKTIILSLLFSASLHASLLHEAVRANAYWKARVLLALGWDANEKNSGGETALHYAAGRGHTKVARLLLDRGASIHEKDRVRATALHRAAWNGHTEVAQLLLDRGANIQEKDREGSTPLHKAAWNGRTEVVQLLLDRGANIQEKDGWDSTALSDAAENGHTEVVQLLMYTAALQRKRVALLSIKNYQGKTAADFARTAGHNAIADFLENEEQHNKVISKMLPQRNNMVSFLRDRELGLKPPLR